MPENQRLDSRFWDCVCEKDYIHMKVKGFGTTVCDECGSNMHESPDSRYDEVHEWLIGVVMDEYGEHLIDGVNPEGK